MRTIGTSALALGALLMLNGIASAGDNSPTHSSFGTTMTLGGQGSADQAAAADDTELTHYYRGGYGGYRGGYYGGYRGGYGGYGGGYRGYYGGFGGGYYGGYRGYYGGYRPYYGGYGYGGYRAYYRPYSYGGFVGYGGFGYGGYSGYSGYYCGISGNEADANAPAVSLNMAVPDNTAPTTTALPVSLTKPTSPYTFKAYGEK